MIKLQIDAVQEVMVAVGSNKVFVDIETNNGFVSVELDTWQASMLADELINRLPKQEG